MTIEQALRVAEIVKRLHGGGVVSQDDHAFIRGLDPVVYDHARFSAALHTSAEDALFVLAEHHKTLASQVHMAQVTFRALLTAGELDPASRELLTAAVGECKG